MKKILFGLTSVAAFLSAGCNDDDLPTARLALFQLESVSATAGDETVTLEWVPQQNKPAPLEYYVSWTAGSLEGENGSRVVEASATHTEIDGLVNDCSYIFAVQPRYADGLARKVSATCTPKSTRIAASDFKAMAGDSRVYLTWKTPETQLAFTYRLTVQAAATTVETLEIESSETSVLVEKLTNGTEYAFSLTCVYAHGDSATATAAATPGEIDPITVTSATLRQFERCMFEYNPAYFVSGEVASVAWDFGDGKSSTDQTTVYCYPAVGTYTVILTVVYAGGNTEQATIEMTVEAFAWSSIGGVGYQKASNIVFSPDGQTLYTIPQTEKKLIAIDAIKGTIVWEYATTAATYGAGPAVGADGTIYFGTEDADGTLHAVTASGALRWKKTLGKAVKASPAVTSDGVIYALSDAGTLFALDATSGNEKWSAAQSGNAGGVVVDAEGDIYFGTSAGIWAYHADGTLKWTCDTAHKVTERGGSLALCDGILYATLKATGGCAAINTTDGTTLWTSASDAGDCYHPAVNAEGTVYFCEKNGYLYAVDKTGTRKWKYDVDKNHIYTGFALTADGRACISQYASPFELLAFDAAGNQSSLLTIGVQTMSPVTIGPDRRIYYGANGTIAAHDLSVEAATTGWPMRGGNAQGTNSLK